MFFFHSLLAGLAENLISVSVRASLPLNCRHQTPLTGLLLKPTVIPQSLALFCFPVSGRERECYCLVHPPWSLARLLQYYQQPWELLAFVPFPGISPLSSVLFALKVTAPFLCVSLPVHLAWSLQQAQVVGKLIQKGSVLKEPSFSFIIIILPWGKKVQNGLGTFL